MPPVHRARTLQALPRRSPLITLLDGPLAGERISPSVITPGADLFTAQRAAPGETSAVAPRVERFEYRRTAPQEARFVRELPQGRGASDAGR